MNPICVNEIDKKRFDALAGLSRSPAAAYISEELGWFANENETILGVLLHDSVDDDFAAVLMACDEGGRMIGDRSLKPQYPRAVQAENA